MVDYAELETSLENLKTDAENGTRLYTDPPGNVTLRTGDVVANLRKRLDAVGYDKTVAFAAGLEVTSGTFTVSYDGDIYAADPSAVPFTTTSTFNPSQWILIYPDSSPTRDQMLTRQVPAVLQSIRTSGYSEPGDGGAAPYIRNGDGVIRPGDLVTADGARWQIATTLIRPEMYGALGGGVDDTAAIDDFLSALDQSVIGLVDKTHIVTRYVNITNKTGFILHGKGGFKIADGTPADVGGFGALQITGCRMFNITGLVINGNIQNRVGGNRNCHLLRLANCHYFTVRDVTCIYGTCDGLYIDGSDPADASTYCSRWLLENCVGEENFRNGLSVIAGRYGTIRGGHYRNQSGHAPQAGIDLESDPGHVDGAIRDILLEGVELSGNAGYGLQIANEASPYNIRIKNCPISWNERGGLFMGARNSSVVDCVFEGYGNTMDFGVITFPTPVDFRADVKIVRPVFRGISTTDDNLPLFSARGGLGRIRVIDMEVDSCHKIAHLIGTDRVQFIRGLVGSTTAAPAIEVLNGADDFKMEGMVCETCICPFIQVSSVRPRIKDNELYEITPNGTLAAINLIAGSVDAVVDDNLLQNASNNAAYGIRLSESYRSLRGNVVRRLNPNEYTFDGDAGTETVGFRRDNIRNLGRFEEV